MPIRVSLEVKNYFGENMSAKNIQNAQETSEKSGVFSRLFIAIFYAQEHCETFAKLVAIFKIGTLIHLVPHTHRQTRASIRRRIVAGANFTDH